MGRSGKCSRECPDPHADLQVSTSNSMIYATLAMDIIRTAYYIHRPEFTKLIFAILYVQLMMGLTHCYNTEGFHICITVINDNDKHDYHIGRNNGCNDVT